MSEEKRTLVAVTEEMHPEKDWFEEARKQTVETLPDFVCRIMEGYTHDYGTVCHAVAACALAGMIAANKTRGGGITGFQASFVMWDLVQQIIYQNNKIGLKMLNLDDLLYPQYEYKFRMTIGRDQAAKLRKLAEENIERAGEYCDPAVLKHWERIADGWLPFGFEVKDDES